MIFFYLVDNPPPLHSRWFPGSGQEGLHVFSNNDGIDGLDEGLFQSKNTQINFPALSKVQTTPVPGQTAVILLMQMDVPFLCLSINLKCLI